MKNCVSEPNHLSKTKLTQISQQLRSWV